jgi:hypothetical protein
MTSYFSVEIPGLVEYYTPQTYWVTFAVIAGSSFMGLFFFSRLLMFFTEVLEDWANNLKNLVSRGIGKRREDEADKD